MNLFPDVKALEDSGYLFRIVDNGGETYDRITVTFCDGTGLLCSASTVCAHIEDGDVQIDSDAVEEGTARDLRWIDLDPYLQRSILADLNTGFADWIADAPAAATREEARNWEGRWNDDFPDRATGRERTPIYRVGDQFHIRDDDRCPPYSDDGDPGPFATFRDAVSYMLPQDYDLSGPEYHTTVDLWNDEGGPAPLWDREADPATPLEVFPYAIDRDTSPHSLPNIGEARDEDHAREIGEEWKTAHPDLAATYEPVYVNKVNRVITRM